VTSLHFPWLELAILVPGFAAMALKFVRDERAARAIAVWSSLVALALTVGAWLDFGTLGTFAAADRGSLVLRLLGHDLFEVDELNAPLLPMTALLFCLAIVVTTRSKAGRFSYGMAMFAESVMLATISCTAPTALILLLFIGAIPPWLELRRRGEVTRVFSVYLGVHLGLLVIGSGLLAWAGDSPTAVTIAATLLVVSSLIRAGIFPAHSWVIDLLDRATFGTALLFIAPMTGAYLVMRSVWPIVPVWALHGVAVLSLFTAVYAAGMSLVQVEARRFFGYLFLSHSSLVLAGLEIANPIGMTGSLCIWLGSGLALGGFGLTLRAVEARTGRISLAYYHGLFDHMPHLGALFLVTGLASIGFPGSLTFIGMEFLIEGTVEVYPLVGTLVVLAGVLNGVSVLRVYFRIFTGTRHVATIPLAARPAERLAAIVLSLLVLGVGLWPGIAVRSRHHAADALLAIRSTTEVDLGSDGPQEPPHSALDDWLRGDEQESHEQESHEQKSDDHKSPEQDSGDDAQARDAESAHGEPPEPAERASERAP